MKQLEAIVTTGGRAVEPAAARQFVGGAWTGADGGATFDVRNPATGDVLARVPDSGAVEARRSVDAAAEAFAGWSRFPPRDRAAVLTRARDLMLARRDALARLAALESGKPVAETRGEVGYAAEFLGFFAEECQRGGGEVVPPHVPGKRVLTVRRPVGVAGLITIWNFPLAGVTRPLAAALAAGCTAVLKPAEQSPLSAVAVFEVLEEAGLPPGVANLVTTARPEDVGRVLVDDPRVRKLNFTGSAEVGRHLLRGAAETFKRVTLELGGHAPLIVFADADVEAAARATVASKFRFAGQTCVAVNRVYVHASVADAFTRRLVDLAAALAVGDPLDEQTAIGPLIDAAALDRVEGHVDDAVRRGARVLTGGRRLAGGAFDGGRFFLPTVLDRATPEMRVMREETFGPIAPVATFTSDDEVIASANGTAAGLAAFFYTRDVSRAWRVAEALECGVVGVNDALPGAAHLPFGGLKHSGIGKEGGRLGLEEFLDTQVISFAL